MSKVRRGGYTLKSNKIGIVNCLRQQILMPGERMDVSINGSIRLESLRERDVLRINAHLATFMTPLRWLWSGYPTYVKEGPSGASGVVPTISVQNPSMYGIGADDTASSPSIARHFLENYLRIYNEWYIWPEDAD